MERSISKPAFAGSYGVALCRGKQNVSKAEVLAHGHHGEMEWEGELVVLWPRPGV
jgi:hypothetical protein